MARSDPSGARRVLLKLSGQALRGKERFGIASDAALRMAEAIATVHGDGCETACVIGGGNIFRGIVRDDAPHASGARQRTNADSMGMLATLINALALQSALEGLGRKVRVLSAIPVGHVAEPFGLRTALRHLNRGRIVIFAAGTGCPYFSTDTAAALRASEIRASLLIKATRVPGVFTADPETDPQALRIPRLTWLEAIQRRLRFMDTTALSLCMENQVPILVCHQDDLRRAAAGEAGLGTWVGPAEA